MTDSFRTPYRGYDVLKKWGTPSWNTVTREVVARRLYTVPERRFFTEDEYALLDAACARLIPQPDRPEAPVPIAPFIDEALHDGKSDGTRKPGMPPPAEAWRRGLRALDAEARAHFGAGFLDLAEDRRDAVLAALQGGDARSDAWGGMPAADFFSTLLLKSAVDVYYAHPWAWNEIGYGGPASPRGYARLAADRRDPWEAEEHDDGA